MLSIQNVIVTLMKGAKYWGYLWNKNIAEDIQVEEVGLRVKNREKHKKRSA